MLTNQGLLRGLFLIVFSLFFIFGSRRYSLGNADQMGPAVFPLIVSVALCCMGIAMSVGALLSQPHAIRIRVRKIAIIILALAAFAISSAFVNMICGIFALVFIASLGAETYSVRLNFMIAGVLTLIALAFQRLLGLDLPLY